MAIKATPHAVGHRDFLSKRTGARIAVSDGAASAAVGTSVWWRIAATSDCQVDFGPSADATSAAAHGEVWPAGHVEVKHLDAADKIAVAAGL